MTEDEAREKWCPFVEVDGKSTCRPEEFETRDSDCPSYCIASECMAWRWNEPEIVAQRSEGGSTTTHYEGSTQGYCGLAGGVK